MLETRKRILFAPLNWGLGHAVRSIPLLEELKRAGFEIILAGNGLSLELLHQEFPDWQTVALPVFEMRYSAGTSQLISVLKAFPALVNASWKEHRQLKRLIKERNIDIVISDNRFGLFNKQITSVYITHQLTIRMPAGFRFFEPLVRRLYWSLIHRYTHCWIPDEEGTINLSGNLSHRQLLPRNARFIGVLSRFQKEKFDAEKKKQYDFLFLLSGVEPQRTLLEEKIISFFQGEQDYNGILIRGVSRQQQSLASLSQLTILNQVLGTELESLLAVSEMVVCRAGYTSIMELASIGKRAVFIPTPGQTEQEYLGTYLSSSFPLFACVSQKELTFSALLEAFNKTQSYTVPLTPDLLQAAIRIL